jgi:thiol-disulfide isomerase/thioredoxin
LTQFEGHNVVLVDFGNYSCGNCTRTIIDLVALDRKYRDQGLVIVGIHTPEFSYERLPENVKAAQEQFGVTYPVILDNSFQTWKAYDSPYLPRQYLIDIDGYIVLDQGGEVGLNVTEAAIKKALAERAERLGNARAASDPSPGSKNAVAHK